MAVFLLAAAQAGAQTEPKAPTQPPASQPASGASLVLETGHVDVEGTKVGFIVSGPADGNEVLLMHGATYRPQEWSEIGTLTELARNGYRAIAVEMPGFAGTPMPTLPMEKFLGKLIETLKLRRPVLVIPSNSGRYGMPLITEQSERFAGFVALAPMAVGSHRAQLKNIKTPTLAMWGSSDRVVPADHADLLVQEIPGARKVIINAAGHSWYRDDPARFHAELLKFLKEEAAWKPQ